jgi:SdrD B-like domain
MKNPAKLILWPVIFFLIASCSDQSNPLNSNNGIIQDIGLPRLSIPSGADLVSASMILNVIGKSDNIVTVHRITSGWTESEVTWASFNSVYDTLPAASFVPASMGDIEVDVSSLVQSWLDGTYENHGIVLRQATTMSQYSSSQAADQDFRPRLVIRYTTVSGLDSTVLQDGASGEVDDAYIGKNFANGNTGEATRLLTGIAFGFEHQTLIQFRMDIPQQEFFELGDFVWNDQNKDGLQDAGELGLPSVIVNLYDDRFNFLLSTYTDSIGFYLFDEIAEGGYIIEIVPPTGYIISPPNAGGNDAFDSDVDTLSGRTSIINLTPGQDYMKWDAGMFIPAIVHNYVNCTRGPGYWKNYAGHGPQINYFSDFLPIWLGTQGGEKSIEVTTSEVVVEILKMHIYGHPSNGITKLYAKLLTAKLNIVRGADDTDIADVIDEVDAFLGEHDWNDWKKLSEDEKKIIKIWTSMINDYNSGIIGPGNCDSVEDIDELNKEE